MKKYIRERIYRTLREIKYCDFHFHWEKDEWYPKGSFRNTGKAIRNPLELILQDYGGDVLIACEGFPFKVKWEFIGECISNEEKAYKIARPFLKKVSNNSKFYATLKGFKILYKIEDLDLSEPRDYWELSKRVKKAYRNGILEWLSDAYEKANIFKCINIWTTRYAREHFDSLSKKEKEKEQELLPATFRFDYFLVLPLRYQQNSAVAKWFWEAVQDVNDMPLTILDVPWRDGHRYVKDITRYLKSITFDDYLKFIDNVFSFFSERGTHQLKSACCLARGLDFQERTEKEARKVFRKIQLDFIGKGGEIDLFEEDIKVFEDFVFYRCLRLAKRFGWNTIQIHTGHRGKNSELGRPKLLEEVIRKNADINFILLHGGKYHYRDVLCLCRKYKNVIADFTWIPILEPQLAEKMVREFIREFPYRTVAGLDMANVEGCAGMADINRNILAEALAQLLEEGKIDSLAEAIRIGKSVMFEKPKELFPCSF